MTWQRLKAHEKLAPEEIKQIEDDESDESDLLSNNDSEFIEDEKNMDFERDIREVIQVNIERNYEVKQSRNEIKSLQF